MTRAIFVIITLAVSASGCRGIQSALEPSGSEATRIAGLFWWMAAGAVAIWVATITLGLYYGRPHPAAPSTTRDRLLIWGAGIVVPLVVLTTLLAYGLAALPPLVARAPQGSLRVQVLGEQWWWRVRYMTPDGSIELANEIRLPVGEPVQFELASDNVLHSFWIPPLGGKMDMIPGRTTYLALHPQRTGIFAGACAEYCGTSHAFMRFLVEVLARDDFDQWLQHQASPAPSPQGPLATRGAQVLTARGCGACHTVRGTAASGRIGPDLTHVGSRLSVGAGALPNGEQSLKQWVAAPERTKPGVHMPAFRMLPSGDLDALAAYLAGLR